jgi:glycosyltransferase involved in cell wall biosynthesis
MKRVGIVLTTINIPFLVQDFVANVERFGHDNVEILIIGDKKSPDAEIVELLNNLPGGRAEVRYLGIDAQLDWAAGTPALERFLDIVPYNSDNRRNIGYLIALQDGADVIISIDDDNYPSMSDFIGDHWLVGDEARLPGISSTSGWFNACSLLENDRNAEIYPRGFPCSKRFQDSIITVNELSGRVAANLGLWTGAPDVDAITQIALPARVTSFCGEHEKILVDRTTCLPINSQNTAVARDAMAAYYFLPMGASVHDMLLDRYGDIWQGYFLKKAIDAKGELVAVGSPLTDHRRNQHDPLKDLKSEFWGLLVTDQLVDWLATVEIYETQNYSAVYLDLSSQLDAAIPQIFPDADIQRHLQYITKCMASWIEAYEAVFPQSW